MCNKIMICPDCGTILKDSAKFCTNCGYQMNDLNRPTQSSPKKLYRSRNNQMIAGVCAGLADYMGEDPTLVRLITVLLLLFTGGSVAIAYLIAMFVIPEEPIKMKSEQPLTS